MSSFVPLETTPPKSEEEDDIYNNICKEVNHLVQVLPRGDGWRLQHLYNYNGFWLNLHTLKNNLLLHTYFKSQPTDIFLASFMKSGTTWLKALMFSTLNRDRYSFTNDHYLLHHGPQSTFPIIDTESYPITDFTSFTAPRLFSTHFSRSLLPPCMTTSCKFVYVCRDPKDVLISKWHFMSKLRSKELAPLSLDDAFARFCDGVSEQGPYWEHVLSYWNASLESPDRILFLKYEQVMKQPVKEVKKLAEFMGKPFTEEEEKKGVIEEVVKLCSFENLSNLEVNVKGVEKFGNFVQVEKSDFFRKGEVGDWKNYLSKEMKERIDGITKDKLRDTGLTLGEISIE